MHERMSSRRAARSASAAAEDQEGANQPDEPFGHGGWFRGAGGGRGRGRCRGGPGGPGRGRFGWPGMSGMFPPPSGMPGMPPPPQGMPGMPGMPPPPPGMAETAQFINQMMSGWMGEQREDRSKEVCIYVLFSRLYNKKLFNYGCWLCKKCRCEKFEILRWVVGLL